MSGYEVVIDDRSGSVLGPGEVLVQNVTCPGGKTALSGGPLVGDVADGPASPNDVGVVVKASAPRNANGGGWVNGVENVGTQSRTVPILLFTAVCVTLQ